MEISKEEMRDLFSEFFGGSAKPGAPGAGAGKRDFKDMDEMLRYTKRLTEGYKKSVEENKLFNRMLGKSQAAISSAVEQFEELDEAIEKEENAFKKRDLREQRRALEELARAKASQAAAEQVVKGLKEVAGAAMSGAGKFIKGLQGGSSGIDLATGLMETSLDMAGSASKAAGDAAGTLGGALATSTNPKVKSLGIAAGIAGPLLGALGESASKLAKFGVEVLSKEVEKTVKAFHDITGAGAMFGRGMDDVRMYANRAGLTVDQFAAVVSGNSKSLAEAGYTVTDGAKIVSNVTSQFARTTGKSGQTLQREMLNLGYGFKEQADLAAQVVGDLRRSGGKATNEQVAKATLDLAKNMKIVADITGEDAKQKMEAAKKQAEQYAFDKKIRELAKQQNDPGLAKRVQASLALMDDTQRRAAIQAVVLNGTVTDVSANLLGQADAGREFNNALRSGNSTVSSLVNGFAKASQNFDATSGDVANAVSTAAIAGVQGLEGYAAAANSLGQQQFLLTQENIKKATEQADTLAGVTGGLQESVISAETAAQNLKLALEAELTPAIAQFAKVSKEMLGAVQDQLKELGIGKGSTTPPKEESVMKGVGKDVSMVGLGSVITGGLLAGLGGLASLTGVGAAVGVPMMAAGGTMVSGGMATMTVGSLFDMLGFAKGGISNKPAIFGEAGPEAAVPLPDGKTIPVTLSGPGASSGADLTNGLSRDMDALSKMSAANQINTAQLMSSIKAPGMADGFERVLATQKEITNNNFTNTVTDLFSTESSFGKAMSTMSTSNDALLQKLAEYFDKKPEPIVAQVPGQDQTMSSLVAAFEEMASTSRQQLQKQDEMIQHLRDQVDNGQRLLSAYS